MTTEISTQDVANTLRDAKWVMVTTINTDGTLLSHPMVPQEVSNDADMWFFISLSGGQSQALHAGPQVNVAVAEAGTWLSVAGTVEFGDDPAKINELWNDGAAQWFDGKDDPALGLIKVTSTSAQFWGQPGGKVASLLQIVKSRVTGERTSGGSDTVEL